MRRAILIAIIFAVVTACLFAQETQNNRGGINITSSKTSAFVKQVGDVVTGRVEVEVLNETGE